MILVTTAYENLSFEVLPPITIPNDNTTETIRVRLHIDYDGKQLSFDIMNVYIPPIHGTSNGIESRIQNFSATNTFTPAYSDYENNNSMGLLIAGDVNAHAWEWDCNNDDDAIGGDIMNFMDDYGFKVLNDSLPTYHAHFNQHNNNDDNELKGETAPDVTFLHSVDGICASDWKRDNPIGKCHHDVLSYQIDIKDCINPLHRRASTRNKTSISWSKVDPDQFAVSVDMDILVIISLGMNIQYQVAKLNKSSITRRLSIMHTWKLQRNSLKDVVQILSAGALTNSKNY
jgi:hypothetical protein